MEAGLRKYRDRRWITVVHGASESTTRTGEADVSADKIHLRPVSPGAPVLRRRTRETAGAISRILMAVLKDYRLKPVGSDTTESRGLRLKPSEVFPAQSRLKAR